MIGVLTLDKKMFYNGDGEFDSERVYVGAIVPMNTADGQVINAQIAEITADNVTIDLNHPLAGENLHFVAAPSGITSYCFLFEFSQETKNRANAAISIKTAVFFLIAIII